MTTSLLIIILLLNVVAIFLLTQKKGNGNEKILMETIERNNQRLESAKNRLQLGGDAGKRTH